MERNEIESLRMPYVEARQMADHLEETTGDDWQVKAAGFCVGDTVLYRIVPVEPEPVDLIDVVEIDCDEDALDLDELNGFFEDVSAIPSHGPGEDRPSMATTASTIR